MLYGKPGASYAIQSSTTPGNAFAWTTLTRIPLAQSFVSVPVADLGQASIFYRAFEFKADPPLLEALLHPDQTRSLLLFGLPSLQYTLEYNGNVSNVAGWHPWLNYTLTNSYYPLNVPVTNGSIFYRLRKN